MRLWDSPVSGNCYKVRLLASQLGLAFERVEVDLQAPRPAGLLEANPDGRVPALVLDDGRALAESGAILCYLAEGTALLPDDRYDRAQVLQWLFFEQYSHEPYIAVLRAWAHFGVEPDPADRERRHERGLAALGVMERWLAGHHWFAAGRFTVADIALYAYTHVAGEGGFELEPFPAIRAWLGRIAAQPGHVPITA